MRTGYITTSVDVDLSINDVFEGYGEEAILELVIKDISAEKFAELINKTTTKSNRLDFVERLILKLKE